MGRSLVFCLVQAPLAILATAVLSVLATLGGLIHPRAVHVLSRLWGRLLLRLFRVEVLPREVHNLPA
ncbi:MAG TPA: hypothetical protein VIJ10_04155, partial [Vicinamibacteria bacterium]